jgi:hypothetical protein
VISGLHSITCTTGPAMPATLAPETKKPHHPKG